MLVQLLYITQAEVHWIQVTDTQAYQVRRYPYSEVSPVSFFVLHFLVV